MIIVNLPAYKTRAFIHAKSRARIIKCNQALRQIMLGGRVWVCFYLFHLVDDRDLNIVSLLPSSGEALWCSSGERS